MLRFSYLSCIILACLSTKGNSSENVTVNCFTQEGTKIIHQGQVHMADPPNPTNNQMDSHCDAQISKCDEKCKGVLASAMESPEPGAFIKPGDFARARAVSNHKEPFKAAQHQKSTQKERSTHR